MCTFRDSMQALTGLGAQVVGISVNDPFSNKAFADANKLQFPLLSDYTRETVKKYGIFHEDFAGLKGYIDSQKINLLTRQKGHSALQVGLRGSRQRARLRRDQETTDQAIDQA